jgi:hypothetical protein
MGQPKNAGADHGEVEAVLHGTYQGREKVLTLV